MTKRIVLLDDHRSSRLALAALLREAGHEVAEARNALEAQALVSESDPAPDLAIIDIGLPGLPGDQWALFLKDVSPDIRIFFVSGQAGLAGIDRYGPDARFFQKPIDPDAFLEAVEESDLMPIAVAAGSHA